MSSVINASVAATATDHERVIAVEEKCPRCGGDHDWCSQVRDDEYGPAEPVGVTVWLLLWENGERESGWFLHGSFGSREEADSAAEATLLDGTAAPRYTIHPVTLPHPGPHEAQS